MEDLQYFYVLYFHRSWSAFILSILYILIPDDDDDYDREREEEDMFCRLEETRAQLESELGCDRFLDVYKSVQVSLIKPNMAPCQSVSCRDSTVEDTSVRRTPLY
jgi:hypothetical protein